MMNGRMSNYYHPGMHSNPAYQGEKQRSADPNNVVVQMGSNGYGEHPRWSWCSMVWAMISAICCSSLCGCLGVLCSVLSYADHKSGDYDRARYKRRWSWCCSMTGLILTLAIITGVLVAVLVFGQQIASAACPSYRGAGQGDPWMSFCQAFGY